MESSIPLLLFIVAVINSISLAILSDGLFARRLRTPFHWVCLLATIPLLFICLMPIPITTSLIRVVAFLFVNCLVLCLFRGRLLVRLFIAIFHYFIGTSLEIVLISTILILGKIPMSQFLQDPLLVEMAYIFPMVILFICCLFLSRIFCRWENQIGLLASEWLAVFLFMVFTLFELYFASILITTDSPFIPILPILGCVLLFMNVSLVLLLNKLDSHHRTEQKNLVLQAKMHYNRISMQASSKNYEAQCSLTHDFNNHLLTIVQFLQSENYNEALAYAQTVMGNVVKADVVVRTNNPIADAVLNQKYRKAQELGVQMQFLVNDLSDFPLSTDEVVIVLANLLDNALEACERDLFTEKKSIRVKLLMEPALATLSVQNTSLPVAISAENEVATTKQNLSEHGYGLKNCKKTLQYSGFDFAMQYKDGWFQFTAIKVL